MKREQSTRKQAMLDVLVGLLCILMVVGSIALGLHFSGTTAQPDTPTCYRTGACR